MQANALLESSTKNLSEIFSNGKIYRVPPFQRDYAWDMEEWEDLWNDIIGLSSEASPHYMGAIVIQAIEDGFRVIDGQQRLVTLSILIIAVLRQMREMIKAGVHATENEERYGLLFGQYIGGKDPVSLHLSSKIYLNANCDSFYQQNLVNFSEPLMPRKLTHTEKKLWEAYEYFMGQIGSRIAKQKDGKALAELVSETVGKRLVFTQILVQDELSAYTVFETLNARGVELTATDLLKNYLLSKFEASGTDFSIILSKWDRIVGAVGMKEFPEFLRHYISSLQPYVRQQSLFKTLKANTPTQKNALELLTEMEKFSYWYHALEDSHDELWRDYPGCEAEVQILNLFRVTQYKPLALACLNRLNSKEVFKVLHACVVISFRFNIIWQKSSYDMERVYNEAAIGVTNGNFKKFSQIWKVLRSIYPDDDNFLNAFEIFESRPRSKRKLMLYILCELEKGRGGRDINYETAEATIEHVLPENPSDGWDDFGEIDRERFTYRLGNMALLEQDKNRSISSKRYMEKAEAYSTSQYLLTRDIRYPEWNPEVVNQRQKEMAKLAVTIWKVAQA